MENENTEYKDGDHNSFIKYVFTKEPKEKNSIKLKLDSPDKNNLRWPIFNQRQCVRSIQPVTLPESDCHLNFATKFRYS